MHNVPPPASARRERRSLSSRPPLGASDPKDDRVPCFRPTPSLQRPPGGRKMIVYVYDTGEKSPF
jgi:hypothetical protein